ncbi:MAG TPA: hypothetical protein VF015_11500, partial [Acidimicrobiales bacterium]
SIGAASAIADRVPAGGDVMAQAASAFTDAFTLTNTVAVGIALTAAAVVLAVARRRGDEPVVDQVIEEEYELELVPVAAADMRE